MVTDSFDSELSHTGAEPHRPRHFDIDKHTEILYETVDLLRYLKNFSVSRKLEDKDDLYSHIYHKLAVFHDALPADNSRVEPFISITLTDDYPMEALHKASKIILEQELIIVEPELWDQYDTPALNRRFNRASKEVVTPGVNIRGVMQPLELCWVGQAGLCATEMSGKEQLEAAGGYPLMNPVDYFMVQLQRHIAKEELSMDVQLMDYNHSATRFPQLGKYGTLWPEVASINGQIELNGSEYERLEQTGIRRLTRTAVSLPDITLSPAAAC